MNLALRAVTQPGDIVAVESPTFFGLLQVLESQGLRALEIPTSPQTGLSLEALDLAVHTYAGIKAVVTVPILQNPLGSIMPDEHKERLVAFCAAQNIVLIEDDSFGALTEYEPAQRALKSWDRTGNVIHCASLQKILCPGLHLGWISAGRWQARVEMLKYAQTRNSEELSQLSAAELMGSGAFDRHLRNLRTRLADQRYRTAALIADSFPSATRLNARRAARCCGWRCRTTWTARPCLTPRAVKAFWLHPAACFPIRVALKIICASVAVCLLTRQATRLRQPCAAWAQLSRK